MGIFGMGLVSLKGHEGKKEIILYEKIWIVFSLGLEAIQPYFKRPQP